MKKKVIDEIDLMIINQLQNNARITNRSLAKKIGLSPGPTLVRVKYLYRRGFLKNCRAALNYPLFNYLLKSVIFISVPEEKYNRFIGNAKATREVTQCFELKMKSPLIKSRQFLVSLMAKDNEDLKAIVDQLCRGTKLIDINMVIVERTHKDTSLYLTEAEI